MVFPVVMYGSEKAMAPHSSTLAWKIPWMEEPGRLQSVGSLRVRHNWIAKCTLYNIFQKTESSRFYGTNMNQYQYTYTIQYCKSRTRPSDFTFTFHFHALEKEMATHSSVLAWRIPGTGEPGGLPSMGSHRVGHNWSGLAAAAFN